VFVKKKLKITRNTDFCATLKSGGRAQRENYLRGAWWRKG